MCCRLMSSLAMAAALVAGTLTASMTVGTTNAQAAERQRTVDPGEKQAAKARLGVGTLGAFTPNGASRDFSGRISELEKRFSFTPSGKAGDGGEKVTVGVTRRVARDRSQPAANEVTAARIPASKTRPAAVGAGLDVGYAGFSLSGGYDRGKGAIIGTEREAVEVGFGYAGSSWRADVQAESSAPADANIAVPDAVGDQVSVELGGAYALSPRLALRGGVRYDRIHPDAYTREFVTKDGGKDAEGRDAGSVYLGGSLRF